MLPPAARRVRGPAGLGGHDGAAGVGVDDGGLRGGGVLGRGGGPNVGELERHVDEDGEHEEDGQHHGAEPVFVGARHAVPQHGRPGLCVGWGVDGGC